MSAFEQACQHARDSALVESIMGTIEWDERTKMPTAAGSYRAEQITYLSGQLHQRQSDPHYGEWLGLAEEEVRDDPPHSDRGATIRELRRAFDKETKLPQRLVEESTKNSVAGQQAWIEARKQSDFSILAPFLKRTIELKRERAEAFGYDECMYDALLDDYEPNESTSRVAALFASLRDQLIPLLQAIMGSVRKPDLEIVSRHYPIAAQREFGRLAAAKIGYQFDKGRLDETTHPFCTTLGPQDVRITTRYDERFFPSAFFGTLHEAGHAIYEQGMRDDQFGLPPGKYCSMAIHESQSRLWENLVGRSPEFWQCFFPQAQAAFPSALDGVSQSAFFAAINVVQPSLIRVEADEITYNLHIIIRFELEQELINGDLTVADLPIAWNERYEQFLGVTPPDDSVGVLQDIHWPASYIGYFPTYAMGNLYAAQFYDQAEQDLGDLAAQVQRGEFEPLRDWLIENIHRQGQCYSAADLVQKVTGSPLSEAALVRRLNAKFREIYAL